MTQDEQAQMMDALTNLVKKGSITATAAAHSILLNVVKGQLGEVGFTRAMQASANGCPLSTAELAGLL